ncbi:MAG: hypothetical protein CMN78_01595 [Spirochaetales bacterium]|nr:hypothetical protein [Spirochaetales bacterium]
MTWLVPLYIGATIFGVGITIADLIGAFSNLTGDNTGDAEADGDGDSEMDYVSNADASTDSEADGVDDSADDGGAEGTRGSLAGHDRGQHRSTILRIMTVLRSAVYFSLGFGPVGLFALTQYDSRGVTLAWSVPIGMVVMVGTRMLRSFMRKDLSSDIKNEDLILEKGVVTVSIGKGQMGKIRTTVGGAYVDRFARAKSDEAEISIGKPIRIVDVADDCVYVEEE